MATTNRTIATRIAASALIAMVFAAPAFAITAGDLLDRMTEPEREGYIQGALEMAMFMAATQERNSTKAQCTFDRFFGDTSAEAARELIAVFGANKDRDAVALITIVINRHCGPPPARP